MNRADCYADMRHVRKKQDVFVFQDVEALTQGRGTADVRLSTGRPGLCGNLCTVFVKGSGETFGRVTGRDEKVEDLGRDLRGRHRAVRWLTTRHYGVARLVVEATPSSGPRQQPGAMDLDAAPKPMDQLNRG